MNSSKVEVGSRESGIVRHCDTDRDKRSGPHACQDTSPVSRWRPERPSGSAVANDSGWFPQSYAVDSAPSRQHPPTPPLQTAADRCRTKTPATSSSSQTRTRGRGGGPVSTGRATTNGSGWVCLAGFSLRLLFLNFALLQNHPFWFGDPSRPMASSSFSVSTARNTTNITAVDVPGHTRSTHHGRSSNNSNPPPLGAGRKRSYGGSESDPGRGGLSAAATDREPERPGSAGFSGGTGHGSLSSATSAQQQAKEDGGPGSPGVDTPNSTDANPSAKKPKTSRGSRGVAHLTREQLERKRANGKEEAAGSCTRARTGLGPDWARTGVRTRPEHP